MSNTNFQIKKEEVDSSLTTTDIVKYVFTNINTSKELVTPIQISTNKETQEEVPHETRESLKGKQIPKHLRNYSLYYNYCRMVDELNDKADLVLKKAKDNSVYRATRQLVNTGVLTTLDKILSKDHIKNAVGVKSDYFLKPLKSPNPEFSKEDVLEGPSYKFYKFSKKNTNLVQSQKVYVLADSEILSECGYESPFELLKAEMDATYERFIEGVGRKDELSHIESKIEKRRQKHREELHKFKNQRLVTDNFSIINCWGEDIVNYMNEMFHRRCPKCNHYIIEPDNSDNPDPDHPIKTKSINQYETWKTYQDFYYQDFEEVKKKENENHPAHKIIKGTDFAEGKEKWASTLRSLKEYFVCPECGSNVVKQRLINIEQVVYSWGWGLEAGKNTMLYGYPGDGKSSIFEQLNDYLKWRYGTPYIVYNVDETTTSSKLNGGYSPMSFATGKKEVRYGVISRALLKRNLELGGKVVGMGANVMLDEINRTPFENISFLMGFFESPHSYILQEDNGRVFLNPNERSDLDNEMRWCFTATMNIQDIGNQPLSLAFKSRFHIIRIRYEVEEMKEVLDTLFNFHPYEENIFTEIYDTVDGWAKGREIKFPAGIRHYNTFFRLLRRGLKKLTTDASSSTKTDLMIENSNYNLVEYLVEILRSSIMMPIIDENRSGLVEQKEKAVKNMAKNVASKIVDAIQSYQSSSVQKQIDNLNTIIL